MLSVVVPVYNEENGVLNTLRDIVKSLDGYVQYEIIVVNDGSTDNTLNIIRGSDIKGLSVVNHLENLGYGRALYDGIIASRYDCIAIIDGDGSYPANSIKELYEHYPDYDMIVGARSGQAYKQSSLKSFARIIFNYLAEYASGRKIPDINSGLRIFRKDVVIEFQDSLCAGFSFTTTITLIFMLNHYFVKYVSIEYLNREGKSKVRHFRDTLRAAQIIVETILLYNPIKLFLMLAVINTAFGLILGIFNHFVINSGFISMLAAICASSFIPIFTAGLLAVELKSIYDFNKRKIKRP